MWKLSILGCNINLDSCSLTLEDIEMCQASSLVWNSHFFRILFYLLAQSAGNGFWKGKETNKNQKQNQTIF